MNKCILIGRLCTDVETRRTNSGKAVSSYRLAVDRQFKQDGQPEADFLNCVAFGSNGEFAGKYLSKGMKIAIEGRIQTRTYDDRDGKRVYITEIIVDHHEFCEKKASGAVVDNPVNNYSALVENYGGYTAPASDFAMLDDQDSQLPF